jgi:predicted ATPase/class 3 adenylate cyclase
MVEQPSGTVTLVFTDIEGSTRLLHELGQDAYLDALAAHRQILRNAFARHSGYEVDYEGDAFFYAFQSASEALAAVSETMAGLKEGPIRIRVGVHTCEPGLDPPKYVGMDVHLAARVMAAGHGGQVLLSQTTRDLVGEGVGVRDLGEHRLRDLLAPQRLYQLQVEGVPSDFPALKTLGSRPTNLPVQPTPLIGREKELAEVRLLLSRDDVRLLTLTGVGGTGKTRLALQVAADLIEGFPNGVFFVSLASVSDVDLVLPTIAQSLGLREQRGETLLDMLNEYLREKQLLLLLDNFEQILKAAPSVRSLLGSASGLRVLVTSRIPLHLSGERTYPVPPLGLPNPNRLPDLSTLRQVDAVSLFIARAEAAKPDFTLTNDNAPAIAEICIRLDGLPLALELAAARIRVLPAQTLLARLGQRLRLLTGGAQDLEERQRTLSATIAWSYDLLSDQEKMLFARLGQFVGGCRIDAAEALCDPEDELGSDVLGGLASLAEKSLLSQTEDVDGEPRFSMLETIREYALERLQESGEAEQIRDRHAACFLRLAEGNVGQVGEPPLPLLAAEQPNLRAALGWFAQRGDGESQLRLAVALARFWLSGGSGAEGLAQLEAALVAAPAAPTGLRARAFLAAASIAMRTGDYERTVSAAREALEPFRASGDERGAAEALRLTAGGLRLGGNPAGTTALLEESLALARKLGDPVLTSLALVVLGAFAQDEGDDLRAYELCAEGRAILKAQPTRELEEVVATAQFGNVALGLGRHDEAEAAYQESLLLAWQLGAEATAYYPLLGLAALRVQTGKASQAAKLAGVIERIFEETGFTLEPWERDLRERTLAEVRARLTDAEFEAELACGRALDLDQVIQLATGNAEK